MYKLVVVALAASAAVSAASRHSRDIKNQDHDAANLVAKSDDKELELSVSLGHLRGTVSALSDLAAAENHRGLQGKGNGKGNNDEDEDSEEDEQESDEQESDEQEADEQESDEQEQDSEEGDEDAGDEGGDEEEDSSEARVVLRHASQRGRCARPQQIIAGGHGCLASCTTLSGLHERQSSSRSGFAFGSAPGSIIRRPLGTESLGGGDRARPRDDDDDDDDAKSMRRQKFDAFVERGKERLGPERVERLERLNEKRKVHAAYVREAGKGSELSMSERMKRLVSAYGPLALGFHVTTEVVVCGLFYLAVDHGLDVGALLRVVESMTGTDMSTVVSSGAGTLGVAYALTVALTGIPRTFLTIAATPYIARKLGWRPKKDV